MKNKCTLSDKIEAGLKKAVAKAIAQHKLLNQSIAIWKNDRVMILPASKVKIKR